VAVKIIDCKLDAESGSLSQLSRASSASSLNGVLGSGGGRPAAEAALLEALLARSLSHPHILTTFAHACSKKQVHSSGEWRQQVWIVQEHCSRGSLLAAIDGGALRAPGGGPNLPAVLAAAQEIAGACLYLHQHDVSAVAQGAGPVCCLTRDAIVLR
jgi:serine/threonine protein kinase